MKKKKRKLDAEWTDRKIHFGCEKRSTKRFCIHAWNYLLGNEDGSKKVLSHDYPHTDAGWAKAQKQAKEYVLKGYTVTFTQTGSK